MKMKFRPMPELILRVLMIVEARLELGIKPTGKL